MAARSADQAVGFRAWEPAPFPLPFVPVTLTVSAPVSTSTVCLPDVSAPLFGVRVWRGHAIGWQPVTYARRSKRDAQRLVAAMRREFPGLLYMISAD